MTVFGKHRSFWLLVLLNLAGYSILPIVFPLLPHYNALPLSDVRTFTPSLAGGFGYALHFLVLYGLYILAWRYVRQNAVSPAILLLVTALYCLPLLLTYPINATDVFRYFVRGRVTAVHGESSLAVPPSAFPDDPFAPLAGQWGDETSPYGPLWELLAAGVTIVSGQNLLVSLFIFKLLGVLCHVGIGALLWFSLSNMKRSRRTAHTLLWAWNPALLYMFVIDAHNDALMLFWLLLGYWVMQKRERPYLGLLLAVLSPLTKLIGLLPVPFFFLSHWRKLTSWSTRLSFLLLSTIGSLLLAALTFLPFGSPLDLALRLLEEVSGGAGFSPGVVLVLAAQRLEIQLPGSSNVGVVAAAGMFLLALFGVGLLWRTWQGRPSIRSAADMFAGYVMTTITFRIWYSAWLFPWLLLDERGARWRLRAGLWFLLTAQLSVVIYGHIRSFLLNKDHLVAHLIGVPFTFFLPVLLAFAFPKNPRSRERQTETPDC